MRVPMQLLWPIQRSKKPLNPAAQLMAAGFSKSHVLRIKDVVTNESYLIDTGSTVSVIPARKTRNEVSDGHLVAANATNIPTYGERRRKVNLGLGRDFVFTFIEAEVTQNILGYDFLSRFQLIVDASNHCLIDPVTKTNARGLPSNPVFRQISNISHNRVKHIIEDFPQLLNSSAVLPINHNIEHSIQTEGKPPAFRPRRLNPRMHAIAKNCFTDLLDNDIIEPSDSEYASPLHMVPKKDSYRVVGDYRALNEITVRDNYPLPHLQDFAISLYGKKVFAKVDMKDAFFQVPIKKEDWKKTAVTTPFGSFNFKRLPLGLKNSAQTFQRFINRVLHNLTVKNPDGSSRHVTTFQYIDDVLIASENDSEHEKDIRAVFQRLAEYNLRLNMHKCEFFQEELVFLGHTLSARGITPVPEKVSAIREFPRPSTLGQLRRFIGLITFYHRFLPKAAELLAPLNELLRGYSKKKRSLNINWEKNPSANEAFKNSKNAIANASLLAYPSQNGQISIHCDASLIAVGAVLQEYRDEKWIPIGFFSTKLSKREQLYGSFTRELIAIYTALKHFRHYLEGSKFKIYTDHAAIIPAMKNSLDRPISKESRMLSFISQFDAEVVHVPGKENEIADLLSRPFGAVNACGLLSNIYYDDLKKYQKNDAELRELLESDSSIKLEKVDDIYVEKCQGHLRPFLPKQMRTEMFGRLHNMGHPGIKNSQRLISKHFVWPNMRKDIKSMAQRCHECQANKITKHNKAEIKAFPPNYAKFSSLHVDLTGPFEENKNCKYLLMMIDRYSRWLEAVPLEDIRSETVLNAFLLHWVARFGIPSEIFSDRGGQFLSEIFSNSAKILGIKLKTTCSFTPKTNGLIELCNKTIKKSLRGPGESNWLKKLPFTLLAHRAGYTSALGCAPSNVVYGCDLRLPSLFIDREPSVHQEPTVYAEELRQNLQAFTPPPQNYNKPGYIDKKLWECPYVFVRNNAKKGLQPHYLGPFKILSRHNSVFKLQLRNKIDTVSIDRLKAAYIDPPEVESGLCVSSNISADHSVEIGNPPDAPNSERGNENRTNLPKSQNQVIGNQNQKSLKSRSPAEILLEAVKPQKQAVQTTRSGREIRPPKRYGE